MRAVVTGVSGFLGSQLTIEILRTFPNAKVFGVFNSSDPTTTAKKFEALKDHWLKYCNFQSGDRFVAISWNELIDPGSGLLDECEYIFHAAASTDFDHLIHNARRANIAPTLQLIDRARRLPLLKRVIHISTAFVAAREQGVVDETAEPKDFNNTYEQSKYESEMAIALSKVPFTIARPSIVIGDSETGYTKHFRVFYSIFRLWLAGVVPRAPLDKKAKADVVPVNFVSRMLIKLATEPRAIGQTVNICAGNRSPLVTKILTGGLKVFNRSQPRFSHPVMLKILCHPLFMTLINSSLFEVVQTLRWHFPYLGSRVREFSNARLQGYFGDEGLVPDFSEYNSQVFSYCQKTRWGKLPVY